VVLSSYIVKRLAGGWTIEPVVDIGEMVGALGDDAPSGPDLAYDDVFLALERSLEPHLPDGRTPAFNEVDWSKHVDWNAVYGLAEPLSKRTRDIRIAVPLARALLAREGLPGFATGMTVLRDIVENLWESAHPELEPLDEGLPPTRTNVLNTLGDEQSVVAQLRTTLLVRDRQAGSFSYRDYLIVTGKVEPIAEAEEDDEEGGGRPSLSQIEGAFQGMDADAARNLCDSIDQARTDVMAVDGFVTDALGASFSPDLSALSGLLKEMGDAVRSLCGLDAVSEVPEAAGETGAPVDGQPRAGIPGTIASRQDALKALEQIAEYFEKQEPSSPVPLLIRRAKRMISMNFLELLEDLNPDAVSPVRHIVGVKSDED